MTICDLPTPSVLVDETILAQNIRRYQMLATQHGKQLWPMTKTHKSTVIAQMQLDAGANGFLCGTLDECDALSSMGVKNIMYAYPVSSEPNISRVVHLAQRVGAGFFVRLDTEAAAAMLSTAALAADVVIRYTLIINSGLNRFGVLPDAAANLLNRLSAYKNLRFCGISTHPGHVYTAANADAVDDFTNQESQAMHAAVLSVMALNHHDMMVTSGSTPTFKTAIADPHINIYHPGNYVFHDVVQVSLGAASYQDCALTVLASVISQVDDHTYLMDAGSKCLGLDQGAHGSTLVRGYGKIMGHDDCDIVSVSEEVGKIVCHGTVSLSVGEKISIIPNHACVVANLTSYLYTHQNKTITGSIPVDIRSGLHCVMD